MNVRVIQTGTLVANQTMLRGEGWSALFKRRDDYEFPAYTFVLEHPEGPILIDTGLSTAASMPRPMHRALPNPMIEPEEELGPQLAAAGLPSEGIRKVILTHLDFDHAGGLAHVPNAEILVHRPEHEFASTFRGRLRYQPRIWPRDFTPVTFDLDPEPYGPFAKSKALTRAGDVRAVPIPGHSIGQVGVVVETGGTRIFFGADHALRQDWFLDDYAAGKLKMLGAVLFPRLAEQTSRRIHALLAERPTVFIPSHDADAPARLAALEPAIV